MLRHLLWEEEQIKADLAMETVKVGVSDVKAKVAVDVGKIACHKSHMVRVSSQCECACAPSGCFTL